MLINKALFFFKKEERISLLVIQNHTVKVLPDQQDESLALRILYRW